MSAINIAVAAPELEVKGYPVKGEKRILTPEALRFIARLEKEFGPERERLLRVRQHRQKELDEGIFPDFLESTRDIRESEWQAASIPPDLKDRRVEITGPTDRKMIINALNSGANIYMADFEDANSPTWQNVIDGQINLQDAVRRIIEFRNPEGKLYQLKDKIATLMVRPRGWHLTEKHVLLDGKPISASIFDFGLYFFHNVHQLLKNGTGPYFYLPKLESHQEARLWNDIFNFAQDELNVPRGTIRATVLIENILAAFEMDEIIYELRDHSAGLNAGRWDYIFSIIRKFRKHHEFLLPDRALVTMNTHLMRSYSKLLIQISHRRGVHAIGGMAAQIPIKNNPQLNETALDKVRADKEREVGDGHDGTWVAHPGLVSVAKEVFDKKMPQPNQISRKVKEYHIGTEDLLQIPAGDITEDGLRANINIGIRYLEAWLRGSGCVPIYNLMEDAATSEISRSQVWQWVNFPNARLNDGREITAELFRELVPQELKKIKELMGEEQFNSGKFELAARLFDGLVT
ncbi:MAG: malate synthase A, partial [Calditrichia bacterium]